MLEYQARRYGRYFGKIGRWAPSTGPCSACGTNAGPKPLTVRQWTCTACGAVHDRDRNAANNNTRAVFQPHSGGPCGAPDSSDSSALNKWRCVTSVKTRLRM